MEAARVAARRGHEVTLIEKTGRLGGLLHLAAMVKGLEIEDLPAIIRYFSTQFRKLGINVQLSTELTEQLIQKLKPDVLVVATGGTPTAPDIPGIDGPNVVINSDLHRMLKFFLKFVSPNTLRSLTRFWMPVGKKVVIIGGGMHGCELAEFLVKRNRKVTIVDSMDELGTDIIQHLRQQLFWWFREKHVELVPGVKPVAITSKGLTVLTKQGYNRTIPADTIIPAVPMKPDTRLADDYRTKVSEVYTVGDCGRPGIIADAIAEGWKIGNAI
jgi:2,4-dienoyl-CoA reductase (NADPH2)